MLALLALAAQLFAKPQSVQPRTYASPSGAWTVRVDPSSRFGDGPARLIAVHDGARAWERELAVTPWEAVVSDEGRVAGWGFSEGPRAWKGALHVVLLSPSGELLLDDQEERKGSASPDGAPNPRVLGAFAQPELDRYVVRVQDDTVAPLDEAWRTYRLSTGERLAEVRPKHLLPGSESLLCAVAARPIRDTPLTLVQWYRADSAPRDRLELGTCFALCGPDLEPVWTLMLPHDFERDERREQDRLLEEIWRRGTVLDSAEPMRFELRHVQAAQRVTYEVAEDASAPSGWSVREVGRAAWSEPAAKAPDPLPHLELRKLSSVLLGSTAAPASGPVRDVVAFDFDAEGRVRFVRDEGDGAFTLVTLDARGGAIRELRVDALGVETQGHRVWWALRGNDWLCTLMPYERSAPQRAWRVDGASGASTELDALPNESIAELRPLPAGGFVTLRADADSRLAVYDAQGRLRWERFASFEDEPGALWAPEDLDVSKDGEIVVLDNIAKRLQFFDAEGKSLRSIELADSWARDESYPTDVLCESGGNLLIHDFHDRTWHRTGADGAELARFVARREDESPEVGDSQRLRVAPDGVLWSTDGRELLALDERGVAHSRFGAPPEPAALSEPGRVFFDGANRVAVEDARTHAVHVFDARGTRVLTCQPDPKDFGRGDRVDRVRTAPDGRVLVHAQGFGTRFLQFGADGARHGWEDPGGVLLAFDPRDASRWTGAGTKWNAISIRHAVDEEAEVTSIERRPDGNFLESLEALACRPDGSLAVLEAPSAGGLAIAFYAPDGAPLRRLHFDGAPRGWKWHLSARSRWIVAHSHTRLALVVSLADGRGYVVDAPAVNEDGGAAFTLSPDESELWCATTGPLALHRYALPR